MVCGSVRNTVEKVTWRDWGGRWPNWGVGVKGPPRPGEIFKNVSRWQNLKVLDDSPNSVELFTVKFFLAEKLTSKVKIPLFLGFVLPTHFQKQVGWGT